jgi:hypothetical protein
MTEGRNAQDQAINNDVCHHGCGKTIRPIIIELTPDRFRSERFRRLPRHDILWPLAGDDIL